MTTKTFLVAVGTVLGLFLVWAFYLTQMSCGLLSRTGPIVNMTAVLECSRIAQGCIDDFQYAKASGDALQLNLVTAQCAVDWQQAGCPKLIAETIDAISEK